MPKRKNEEYEEAYDEEESFEEDTNDDSLEYQRHEGSGESIVDKPTMDTFFNTEELLYSVEKTMKGFQKKAGEWVYATTPKARDSFINTMINSLRSVINQQNMISRMNEDQAKFLLLEKNKEFIFLIYEEPSIDDEDVETVINIFDHALEIFMGHVIEGHGARTFRQVSANVSYEVQDNKKDDGMFSFGIGNQNLVKIGGKKN